MLFSREANAQTPQYSISANPQCANSSGVYTSTAAIVAEVTGATSYSWQVITATTPCAQTITPISTGTLLSSSTVTNDAIVISLACCGDYTVICFGWNGGTFIQNAFISQFQSGGQASGVIYCPNGASITASSQNICRGSSTTLTAISAGIATYTWSDGSITAAPNNTIAFSPTVNTCYTYTGTTSGGCTVTPLSPVCVSVQAITATVSPATQSMCLGSPVSFTASTTVVTGTNVTAGTSVTGYQWYSPIPSALGTASTQTAPAVSGPFTVVVTHTGSAGTCTTVATAAVVITTSIPVSITPSSFSICPNQCLTLTAVSIQTASGSYTWTQSAGGPPSFTGNPAVRCSPGGPSTLPRSYTVVGDYFGCPGTATITIGLLALTPTLTSSALTSCPGRSITLSAGTTPGTTYTFQAIPSSGTPTNYINKAATTTPSVAHTPGTTSVFPIQYCLSTYSAGCTGTTCLVVSSRTLTPTLIASSPSICPNTQFTLTASGSGVQTGSTYTFSSGYSGNIGNANPLAHTVGGPFSPSGQTYSVTVDSAGCIGTGVTTINLLTLKPILSSASPSICAGTSLTLTSTGGASTNYTFTSSHPGFDGIPTSTSVIGTNSFAPHTPPVPTPTLITYTVSVDSAGCKGLGTYSIGILDLGPTLTLTTIPASGSVCPGTSFTVNASGSLNYSFFAPPPSVFSPTGGTSPNGFTTFSSSITSPNPIPIAGVVYTVQADSVGCVGTKTFVIREYQLNPGIILSPTIVCSGQPITVTATNVVSGTYTFFTATSLSPIPSLLTTGPSTTVPHNPTIQTVYSVVVDSAGCKSIFPPPTATITLLPDLALLPSTSAASVCPGITTTLSVSTPTTALNYTYTWSQITGTGQITPINSQSIVAYPTSNSTYSINVLDSLGCVGNTVISVGIDPGLSFPITLASSGSTICQISGQAPQTVTLTASSTITPISLGAVNYTWTPNISLTPSNTNYSVTSGPSVTTLYTVTASNGYGCVAQNTIIVPVGTVPPANTPNAVYSGVCVGFTSTLTAFGAISYTWTGNTFTNAIAQQSISVGAGSYTVLMSNGGGCTNIATRSITPLPDLIIPVTASSPTTCIESNSPKYSKPVHLTATGAGSYVWFPYNPIHMTYSLGAQTDVRPPVTTIYTVVGSSPNCAGKGTITVAVIQQFSMNVTPPLPAMCIGDSLQLDVVNIGSDAVGPAYSYSWTEALNAPPISMSNYFTPSVMVYPQNTTTYTTEVRDSRGCISFPKLVTVTVLPRPLTAISIPTINSVATNTVCFVGLNPGALDVTINLTGNNMNLGLQFGIVPTYSWISPYAPRQSILTPANNNAITISAPIRELNNSAIAVYTLISGYNGVVGCKREDTVSVRVVDCRPVRNFTFTTVEKNDTICARNCITYINQADTMAGGPQTYTWTFKGGSPAISHQQNPTVCYNFPGTYDVILQVANPYPRITLSGAAPGSTNALGAGKYITIMDMPNVTIITPGQRRSDTTVRFGQSVNLSGSGALSYEWSPSYNITSLSKPKVTVSPFKTTQYILTGYNSKHCLSSDTINVNVIEDCGEMYVPNAFTPNNDGVNDVLYVRGICLQSLSFMIFNRWGEKVFETAVQSVGWDGSYKGQELNTGVFVYRLEGKTYDGKGYSSKGNITLLR